MKTFNVMQETTPVSEFAFAGEQQKHAAANNVERVFVCHCYSRSLTRVPQYIKTACRAAGYDVVAIGGTTNRFCVVGLTSSTKVVEKRSIDSAYGFSATQAIIDHPKHGRLFVCQMYGGEQTHAGGAVRWEHGLAIKLLPNDTFDDLDKDYNNGTTVLDVAMSAYDDNRPVLEWPGYMIEKLAKRAGL